MTVNGAVADVSEVGNVAGISQEQWATIVAGKAGPATKLGPFDQVHVFWLAGMSCDGCSIAVVGATQPSVESLMTGSLPGIPIMYLHHTALQVEAGDAYIEPMRKATLGELGAPYVIVYEGSIADESKASLTGGYWSAIGEEHDPETGESRQVPSAEWLQRLAPGAAAVVAIGTCATWGGIPAAYGNLTGSMSMMDFLGNEYRSALGLAGRQHPGVLAGWRQFHRNGCGGPAVPAGARTAARVRRVWADRPGCSARPSTATACVPADYEEGTFADEYGDKECLVEIGCWGPVVELQHHQPRRHQSPRRLHERRRRLYRLYDARLSRQVLALFYKRAPGTPVSSTASRLVGSFIRPLRRITQRDRNREVLWDRTGVVASGWGRLSPQPTFVDRLIDKFYNSIRKSD